MVTAGVSAGRICSAAVALVMMVHGDIRRCVLLMMLIMSVTVHRLRIGAGHCRRICGKTLRGQGKQQYGDQQCTEAVHRVRV